MASDAARHAALAVESRRRLLDVLQSAGDPMDVTALAAAVKLHVTTARVHLRVLEQADLVHRASDHRGRMGRPRQLYVASAAPRATAGHRQLATVLAGALSADPDVALTHADRAGRQWAYDEALTSEHLSWAEANDALTEVFQRLGFAPRMVESDGGWLLEMAGCPFRELALAYPQVVCAVHRGLLHGLLERLGSPVAEQAELLPFVEPELCIVDLPTPCAGSEAMQA